MVLHHNAKYFLDFIEFVIDEELFRIPSMAPFASDSLVLGPRIKAGEKPIDLTGSVSVNEFEQFLEIILPLQITSWLEHSIAQWCLVLKLANAWQIEPLRKVAILKMGWDDTISRIEKGHQYLVAEWVEQGYVWLLQRFAPLTLAESERLGWPVALKICHLREERAKGRWNHPDLASRINTAFADEFKKIRDACTWLSKPKAITMGPAPIANAQQLKPVDSNGTVRDLPEVSASASPGSKAPPAACPSATSQTFAFTPFCFERPPARPAFVFGPSNGDKAQSVGPLVDSQPLKATNGNADNPTKASTLSSPGAPAGPTLTEPQTSLPFPLVKTNATPGSERPASGAPFVFGPVESKGSNANPELPEVLKSASQVNSPKSSTPQSPKSLDDSKRSPTQGTFGLASESLKAQEEILGPVPIVKPDPLFDSKRSCAQPTFFSEPSGSSPQEGTMGAVPNVKPDALAADPKRLDAQTTSLTGGVSKPPKPIKVNGRTSKVNLPKAPAATPDPPSDSKPESSSAVRPPDPASEGRDDVEARRILSRSTPAKWDI